MNTMKYAIYPVASFAPYPGSALGNQLIAEGKSLMTTENYHRFPGERKMIGIDYDFYDDLAKGKYNDEIYSKLHEWGNK